MSEVPRLIRRTYAALLHLLPARMRQRHGAAMQDAFAQTWCEAASDGRLRALRLLAGEAVDLMLTGVTLRVRAIHHQREQNAMLADDMMHAVRSVTRNAAFFAFAAVTLGFGVGTTTAMYSALKSVVLEPAAYAGGERAVKVWRTMGSGLRVPPSAEQIDLVSAQTVVFDAAAPYTGGSVTVTGLGEPVKLNALYGGSELADFMGVQPAVGRMFRDDELAGSDVVLLSHALWRSHFGGRVGVTGEVLRVDGRPFTIVGVLPAHTVRPDAMPEPIDLWLPLAGDAAGRQLMARLAPGVTLAAAQERLDAVMPETAGTGIALSPATAMRSSGLAEPLRVLMIAVGLLLLVACVNVSNLLLHRNAARGRDTAVRAALGASRIRLIRHSLAESLLLALCGGAIGVLVAWAGTTAAAALRPADLAAIQTVRIDRGVLVFSLAISLGAWLLFSLLPALRSARIDAAASLSSAARVGTGGSARLRWTLVGLEVALSFTLLVGATTLLANVRESAARDTGYAPDGFVAVDVTLPEWRYGSEQERRAAFDELLERAAALPDVDDVALASGVPPRWGITFGTVRVEGGSADGESTIFHGGTIDDAYLRVIGQPLTAGRTFLPHEARAEADVVILGETAARRIFGDADAVGRRLELSGNPYTVIGVARDIAIVGLAGDGDRPIAYWPMTDVSNRMQLLLRTSRRDRAFLAELASLVRSTEAEALVDVATGTSLMGATLARERFTAALLTTFAAVALALSAIGLYGVLSQIVTGRTHEIGLRVALGADQPRIRRLVLGTGARVVAAGLLAGTLLVWAGLRVLGSSVFGIEQRGAGVYVIAAIVLGATSLIAMWWPAMRAARIDPMKAMTAD